MAEPTISADDHRHGFYAQGPLPLFCMVCICAGFLSIFSLLQITGTEQSIFDLLQSGIQILPGLTGNQAEQLLNGSLDHNHTIAGAIGWGVQFALLTAAMPPEQALAMMHRKYNHVVSASLAQHAELIARIRFWLLLFLIGGDILTDFVYALQGHVTLDGWQFSVGGGAGVILVGLLYPAAICFVTFFAAKYLFAYLGALIAVLRGTKFTVKTTTTSAK